MTEQSAPSLQPVLDRFIDDFIELHRTNGGLPQLEYDPEWPSLCYQETVDAGEQIYWKPVRQKRSTDLFIGLEHALGLELHPDIKTYYGRYWSESIPARSPDGELSLIFIWNDDDYERLRSNLIGHALAKRKQRRPLTLFFGCPDSKADYFLSLENDTGKIWLEQPGKKPLRELAPSMAAFIETLKPGLIT